jgi:GTPase Era involved in 16S rRNA processing
VVRVCVIIAPIVASVPFLTLLACASASFACLPAARVCHNVLTSYTELIVGVTTRADCQIVFYDSPGVLDLQSQRQLKLPRLITTAPAHAISQVDHALLVIDASSLHLPLRKLSLNRVLALLKVFISILPAESAQCFVPRFSTSRPPQEYPQQHTDGAAAVQVTVALNKVDLVSPKSKVVPIVEDVKLLLAAAPHCAIDEIFMLCALPGRRDGVDDLTQHLMSRAGLRPWLHSSGTVSTSTLESVVVEMIRERLFYHIRQEVPYSCRVIVHECQKSEEQSGRSIVQALASIVVSKSLHKVRCVQQLHCASKLLTLRQSMVIGPSGSNIRKICQEAEVTRLCTPPH